MCGQPYSVKRISLKSLVHDAFHFFTHLDKGFGYTLKQLAIAPGVMEREYVEGNRHKYQKPFSMFILCASINGLGRYWIFRTLVTHFHTGKIAEASFFHEYMVVLYALLVPLFALITWAFFARSQYNYAETGVLQLYMFSFIFLAVTLIALLKFIWPELDTAYIELPLVGIYTTITLVRFYNRSNPWWVALRAVILIVTLFVIAQRMEDLVMAVMKD